MGNCSACQEEYETRPRYRNRAMRVQTQEKNQADSQDEIRRAFDQYFNKYDLNHDGFLQKNEIVDYFKDSLKKQHYNPYQVETLASRLICTLEKSSSGKISRDKLYRFYKKQ